jgi:uncharacterized membrane protein
LQAFVSAALAWKPFGIQGLATSSIFLAPVSFISILFLIVPMYFTYKHSHQAIIVSRLKWNTLRFHIRHDQIDERVRN